SAPPAFRVRARFAVSVVTWRQAETRWPESGCSLANRSRIAASTGIWRSAHAILRIPSDVSARSFTSWRCVVAMASFRFSSCVVDVSCGEQPLVLSLLPLDPGGRLGAGCLVGAREPRLERSPKARIAAQPQGEGDLAEVDAEAAPEIGEPAELVQLPDAVPAVAARRAARDDESRALEVAQHAGRPARALRCRTYR